VPLSPNPASSKLRLCPGSTLAPALRQAAAYFQQAIDKDPGYALAWAGLADCYALYSHYGVLSPTEAFPENNASDTFWQLSLLLLCPLTLPLQRP
jgi:hypothetical protein